MKTAPRNHRLLLRTCIGPSYEVGPAGTARPAASVDVLRRARRTAPASHDGAHFPGRPCSGEELLTSPAFEARVPSGFGFVLADRVGAVGAGVGAQVGKEVARMTMRPIIGQTLEKAGGPTTIGLVSGALAEGTIIGGAENLAPPVTEWVQQAVEARNEVQR
jgi:hypothetical protein